MNNFDFATSEEVRNVFVSTLNEIIERKDFVRTANILMECCEYARTAGKKINILYHGDLDGNASAYAMLEYLLQLLIDAAHSFPMEDHIRCTRINYNYDITRLGLDEDDLILIVDYSLTEGNHIDYLLNSTKETTKIIWIDHHFSSIKTLETNEKLNDPKIVSKFLYTKQGISATALVYFVCAVSYKMSIGESFNVDSIVNEMPMIFRRVSLYDTFHPLSERKFYHGIATIEYDMQILMRRYKSSPIVMGTWDALLDPEKDVLSPTEFVVKSLYCNMAHYNVPKGCATLDEILEKGAVIEDYEIHVHKMAMRSSLFYINLNFEGEVYNVAVINNSGNSFVFEDIYYDVDGVILFQWTNKSNYIYSIYANLENRHHVPCNEVAERLGGGGHPGAAGFTLLVNIFDSEKNEKRYTYEINNHKKMTNAIPILKIK